MVRATSSKSYKDTIEEGLADSCQEQVYQVILRYQPVCDSEIASYSGLNINNVTARRNELVDKGMVKADHIEENAKTNRVVTFWCVGKQEQPISSFLSDTEIKNILNKISRCTAFQARLIKEACEVVIAGAERHPEQKTITSRDI